MNGIPSPYPNGTRLEVGGKILVVTDHAPHAEDWRYTGHEVNAETHEIRFSHYQAHPVTPSLLAAFSAAEQEVPGSPLDELIRAVAELVHRGLAPANLAGAYIAYRETA